MQAKEEINSDGANPYIQELDAEVDGKQISQHRIKDIACSSNCLFMTTGNYLYL